MVSGVPDQPTNSLPANGALRQVTTPILQGTAFSDLSETHTASYWRVYSTQGLCQAGGSGDLYDSGQSTDLEEHQVQAGGYPRNSDVWWSVQYQNSYGNISEASTCTSFQVRANSSSQIGTSPSDELLEEDEGQEELDELVIDDELVVEEDLDLTDSTGLNNSGNMISVQDEVEQVASVTAGQFVTNQDHSKVYYQDQDNLLHPFYNLEIFFTWADFDDQVAVLEDEVLGSMQIGVWMLPKPGTVWVKTPGNSNVYAIQENPENLYRPFSRWISSETVAMGILGADWADYIIDVPLRILNRFIYNGVIDRTNDHLLNTEEMIKREKIIQ